MTWFQSLMTAFQLISPAGGYAWFHNHYDGTTAYESCEVRVHFARETNRLDLSELAFRCDQGPGFTFADRLEPVSLEVKGERLVLEGAVVGTIVADRADFRLRDAYESQHVLSLRGLTDPENRFAIDWAVESLEYPSFNLIANGFSAVEVSQK